MKYTFAIALIGAASAVKIENEYPVWGALVPPEPMNSVVSRGSYDSTEGAVEAAMKSNPTNAGKWPVDPVAFDAEDNIPKPHYAKQNWEDVVKKGNSAFNDK